MAEADYLVCLCVECLQSIEFLAYGVGQEIECPNCHKKTKLYNPAEELDLLSEKPVANFEERPEANKSNFPPLANLPPIAPPIITEYVSSAAPSLKLCKTCGGQVAESCNICVHCGQNWPTINLCCPYCGANDFDIETIEDDSSVWVSPSLMGVIAAGIWGAMRAQPQCVIRCLQCGGLSKPPSS